MQEEKIKILVVDDSLVARSLLTFIIESDPELEVIGNASDGKEALLLLEHLSPDVITMDIAMPNLNGFEATQKIMRSYPLPIVIVSGLYSKEDAKASFRAIDVGAIALVPRPIGVADPEYRVMAQELIDTIKQASKMKLVNRQDSKLSWFKTTTADKLECNNHITAIGIGSSLGGPKALESILSTLPIDFPVPIFIAQHIATGFSKGLVDWLQQSCKLKIEIAKHNEKAFAGNVYIPPDNSHMEVLKDNMINLVMHSKTSTHPSIAKLFSSMANNLGASALGIILTGMGQDGAKELLLMRQKGAITIAQDEESSVMFGMPQVAIKLNAATYVISLQDLGDAIIKLVMNSTNK